MYAYFLSSKNFSRKPIAFEFEWKCDVTYNGTFWKEYEEILVTLSDPSLEDQILSSTASLSIPLYLASTGSTSSSRNSLTCSGALPTKLEGSKSEGSWGKIGAKYESSLILLTRSLSAPCCFTCTPASCDNTRIFSWQTWNANEK